MAAETTATLFTVASPGRSGTMWYSRLFTGDNSYCFHELTSLLRRYPTNAVALDMLSRDAADHDRGQTARRLLLEGFPRYFHRLWEEAARGATAVGNSDHLATPFLPGLWLVWPRMRFLFSFRNGINQVGSQAVRQHMVEPAVQALRQTSYGTDDHFEQCCWQWASTVAALESHREWLAAQGADVLETRLERMLADPEELRRVWEAIVGDWDAAATRILAHRGMLVNAGLGAPSPEQVWDEWPAQRRETFTAICGEAQRRLGYAV